MEENRLENLDDWVFAGKVYWQNRHGELMQRGYINLYAKDLFGRVVFAIGKDLDVVTKIYKEIQKEHGFEYNAVTADHLFMMPYFEKKDE